MNNYELLITTIRELVLDLNPVKAFTVTKQGLLLEITETGIVYDSDPEILFEEVGKIYSFVSDLKLKGAEVEFPDIYIPLEYCSGLGVLSRTDLEEATDVMLKNFFSEETVKYVINDYFNSKYSGGSGRFCKKEDYFLSVDPVEEFETYDHYQLQAIALWVAYYLIESKKAVINSSDAIKSGLGYSDDEFLDTDKSITTRINDVFTINETPKKADSNNSINSVWGDSNGFLTKLQLYLRSKYEKLCGDYSLRTDSVVQTSSILDKHWFPDDYYYEKQTSELSQTILFENR